MVDDHQDNEQVVDFGKGEERRIEKGDDEKPWTADTECEGFNPCCDSRHPRLLFYSRSDRSFSKTTLCLRPADWRSGQPHLLPAGTHAEPLRREGASRGGPPRARQPDARVLADWRR